MIFITIPTINQVTMKVVKHKVKMPIVNLDTVISAKHVPNKHGILLPNSIRCLICGPSNCGKSNVMLTLLFDKNGLEFENVYIYSKSLYQPKYKYLEEVLQKLKGIKYYPFKENNDIIDVEKARNNSVFIFDDIACSKQDKIREYFSMGRHNGIDSFYLCQTYSRIPKQLIRDNANFIILFKQDDLNLKHVYNDHVGSDMTFEQFKNICSFCWQNNYNFLVIDKDSDIYEGRYRKNLDNIIKKL